MGKEDVLNKIKSAFAGVTLGNGVGLWEAQAIDYYEPKVVQKRNRTKDEKEDWNRLNYEDLQRCQSSLSFFDADGMRFHLPAFILASLDDTVGDLIIHLTRLTPYAKSQLTLLNRAQRHAIVMYLHWCLEQADYQFERPAIQKALSEYWEK